MNSNKNHCSRRVFAIILSTLLAVGDAYAAFEVPVPLAGVDWNAIAVKAVQAALNTASASSAAAASAPPSIASPKPATASAEVPTSNRNRKDEPVVLLPPVSAKPVDGAAMNYAGVIRAIESGKGNEAFTAKRLIGNTVQLTLKVSSPGPGPLYVKLKDETYFDCEQRSPSFKGGAVTAVITGFAFTVEGAPLTTLDACK